MTGNDPLDPASFFAVDRVAFESGPGTLRFSWPSVTNRFYTVLSTTNAPDGWSPTGGFTHVPGTGQRLEFSTTPAGTTAQYFRVSCEANGD